MEKSFEILERTPGVLKALLEGLSDEWLTNNEGKDTWSPFDVLGHLVHGERTDWMARTEIILGGGSDTQFEPFDRFAQFEESKDKTISDLLIEFEGLRRKNLKKLRGFKPDNEALDKEGIHPHFGRVTLRQLLATWVAHDLGHLNQISRVMAKQYTETVGPWKEYMGVLTRY